MANVAKELNLPLMGEGITEATVVKWLKKVGDEVKKDEAIVEVSTDKVDTEITAPYSGYLLKTYAPEGATVAVHATMAHIGDTLDSPIPNLEITRPAGKTSSATAPTNSAAAASRRQPPPHATEVSSTAGAPLRATPLVRKMARETNLNLAYVAGRGINGRITKQDILTLLDQLRGETSVSAPVQDHGSKLVTTIVDGVEKLEGVPVRREKMPKMRRLIAEHMVSSVRTSPHVTTTFEMDLHDMKRLRETLQPKFVEKHGFKLTFTHLLAFACIQAIKRHPIVNTSVDGDEILFKDDINLGIAVAIDSGLIVPVLKKANNLTLEETAVRINDLVQRARAKKLNPDDAQGGTFSITNPGLFGSLNSNPIINQPQVAILSVGAMIDRPVVRNQEIVIRPLMHIGLTFDHRVVDGEGGAKFLADLQKIIENISTHIS